MSTFADPKIPVTCLARLELLRPEIPRQWGRMTAHQMVCHLNDAFDGVTGGRDVKSAANPFSRTAMKWFALRVPLPWPKGIPSVPEMAQDAGGTPPGEWASDVARLRQWIESFPTREHFVEHPFFGAMSRSEWMRWGWLHVDHHFRQFGV